MNTQQKILSLDDAAAWSLQARAAGQRVVATNGCFDLLHVGHVRYLEQARSLGDALIVGINGDISVRELKGEGRPVNKARDRAEMIAALAGVDAVVVFEEVRATRFLEFVQPSLYVKGGDYSPATLNPDELAVLKRAGSEIQILPFETGYSTTGLLDRLKPGKNG